MTRKKKVKGKKKKKEKKVETYQAQSLVAVDRSLGQSRGHRDGISLRAEVRGRLHEGSLVTFARHDTAAIAVIVVVDVVAVIAHAGIGGAGGHGVQARRGSAAVSVRGGLWMVRGIFRHRHVARMSIDESRMKRGLAAGELLSLLGSRSARAMSCCPLPTPTLPDARRRRRRRGTARSARRGDWKLTEWQVDSSELRSPGHVRCAGNGSCTSGPARDWICASRSHATGLGERSRRTQLTVWRTAEQSPRRSTSATPRRPPSARDAVSSAATRRTGGHEILEYPGTWPLRSCGRNTTGGLCFRYSAE